MRAKNAHRKLLATSLALLLTGVASASLAADAKPAVDIGPTNSAQTVNMTLVLKLHNESALESYIYQTVDRASPLYHRFLTTAQFAARYGATDKEIEQVRTFLQGRGIAIGKVLPSHMAIQATGTIGQFSALFQAPVHDYVNKAGKHFHRPSSKPVLPAALANTLAMPIGLNNEAHFMSHRLNAVGVGAPPANTGVHTLAKMAGASSTASGTASGIPGEYTVGDVANFYNINPLYRAGIRGQGTTIGIVTLADFSPADATAYWNAIGLRTKPNRIIQMHVDGGGEVSSDAGSGETALDVEQSGGLAPFADIRVYDAPNTDSGFIDAFATAVSDNVADSISVSWGSPEIFYFNSNLTGADNTAELEAFHQVFLEAAVQGISMFAAAGDSGAYDTDGALGHTDFSAPLTVDAPASDPFITAAGGTTVPFTYHFGSGPAASIDKESVWGWGYLQTYLDKIYPGSYDLFATGGGGGVSVYWHKPFYQSFTRGIRKSAPHQSLDYLVGTPQTLLKLPAHFAGRNVPDISLNADPETGYLVISSTDSADGIVTGEGGTSFVAPQLNGISALLTQSAGHRVGFWNPQVYALQNIFGYGPWSAFKDIKAGDNWHYSGKRGYEPGAGLGALNVTNLSLFLRTGF